MASVLAGAGKIFLKRAKRKVADRIQTLALRQNLRIEWSCILAGASIASPTCAA